MGEVAGFRVGEERMRRGEDEERGLQEEQACALSLRQAVLLNAFSQRPAVPFPPCTCSSLPVCLLHRVPLVQDRGAHRVQLPHLKQVCRRLVLIGGAAGGAGQATDGQVSGGEGRRVRGVGGEGGSGERKPSPLP